MSVIFSSTTACETDSGCNFYGCLESVHPCGLDGYAVSYGMKYCKVFTAMAPSMSSLGQDWVEVVRKCLQVKLKPVAVRNLSMSDCTEFHAFAFNSHPDCYASQDWSLCRLQVSD